MAKRSRSRNNSTGRRVALDNANRRLPTVRPSQLDLEDYLREIEDRRTFHPEGPVRNARSFHSPYHSFKAVTPSYSRSAPGRSAFPSGVGFMEPEAVLICVRRKQRKEVLHAKRKTGKTGQKRPRRSYFSDIHC